MGRPATGQTRVMGFRPPESLRAEFEQRAKDQGRTPSEALIEAMHLWLDKHRKHPDKDASRVMPGQPQQHP